MPHASQSFFHNGFGKCIYCGHRDHLTDEHIIPFSLGGFHVISDASCKICAAKTSRLERRIARDLWGDARIAYDAPSRRKKNRPKHLTMGDIQLRTEEFPGQFIFYEMPVPGILAGMSSTVDTSVLWKLLAFGSDSRLKKAESKFPGKVTIKFRHQPNEFGRLLLKIGYCQALTVLKLGDLTTSFHPYIFEENANVSYLVGAASKRLDTEEGIGSFLGNYLISRGNQFLVVSQIQIFANLSTPIYDVVVGAISDQRTIERLLPKLDIRDATRRMIFGP